MMTINQLLNVVLPLCSVNVQPSIMQAIIDVESARNPFAIGVVDNRFILKEQPRSLDHAMQQVEFLEKNKQNYSIGLAQINIKNIKKMGIAVKDVFDVCTNLKLSSIILRGCHKKYNDLGKTISCYYGGNDKRGYTRDFGNTSYVERVISKYEKPLEHIKVTVSKENVANIKKSLNTDAKYKFVKTTKKSKLKLKKGMNL